MVGVNSCDVITFLSQLTTSLIMMIKGCDEYRITLWFSQKVYSFSVISSILCCMLSLVICVFVCLSTVSTL